MVAIRANWSKIEQNNGVRDPPTAQESCQVAHTGDKTELYSVLTAYVGHTGHTYGIQDTRIAAIDRQASAYQGGPGAARQSNT